MKLSFLSILALPFMMMGCAPEYVEPAPAVASANCVIVADAEYGERQVCGTQYYQTEQGVVYYDPYYSAWIGGGGYWSAGRWYHGYPYGYFNRYRGYYHQRGFYGYHGGGYHGGRNHR